MSKTKIFNGKVVTPYRMINNGSVIIDNGRIIYTGESNIDIEDCCEINAQGCYISPGFIDIHTHGGGGHDFYGRYCGGVYRGC